MKICIVAPRFTYPENGGDVVLLNDIMHYLKNKGHDLIFISFYKENQLDYLGKKFPYAYKVFAIKHSKLSALLNMVKYFIMGKPLQCGYYYSYKMLTLIKNINVKEKPDIYICHLLRMLPYFDKLSLKHNVIVQMSDVLSKTYDLSEKSNGSYFKKCAYNIEKNRIKKYEKYCVNTYPKVVLVTENDKNYFGNRNNIYYHNNGIRKIVYESQINENKIVFVGNMRTLQNVDGCLFFIRNIFPLIKNKLPNAVLYVVGACPSKKIVDLQSDCIKITGYVSSIENEIKNASISVAPIRVAAGIQNKVLISMACNVPVVLSSLIAKGIPQLVSGNNCYIEDEPQRFAEKCISLMTNKDLRNEIIDKACNMVKNNYYWDIHLQGYEYIKENTI